MIARRLIPVAKIRNSVFLVIDKSHIHAEDKFRIKSSIIDFDAQRMLKPGNLQIQFKWHAWENVDNTDLVNFQKKLEQTFSNTQISALAEDLI